MGRLLSLQELSAGERVRGPALRGVRPGELRDRPGRTGAFQFLARGDAELLRPLRLTAHLRGRALSGRDAYHLGLPVDEPSAFAPTAHVWTEDRIAWLAFADGLPHYERASVGGVGERNRPTAKMEKSDRHRGACLCGAVRYQAGANRLHAIHCHCESCRRSAGAAFMTFAGFAADAVTLEGELTDYRSSERAVRGFCGRCGSPVRFAYDAEPERVSLTVGTLDRPERAPVAAHMYVEEMVSWVHIEDDSPRYDTEMEA